MREVISALERVYQSARHHAAGPTERTAELTALQGYSEVLVRKLERRNSELQLTKEQLLYSNKELLSQTEELVKAKETLEVTAKQLKTLFDNLDDGFFSLDMITQQVLQISPACERVYGLPRQAFLNNPMLWKEAALAEDRGLFREGEADLRAGKQLVHEYRIQRPDEKICWVQSKIKPTLDENGRLVRIDGVVSDITERKRLEQQLSHSQKLEAVGRLAGGIAHDFNNVLTAITGYSELVLARLEEESPLRPDVDEIRRSGERAAALTRQLLAFSRKQILEPKILDLNSVVASTEKLLGRLIGEDIELVTIMAPDLNLAKVDPGQIEQVIVNLAVNARDAMPEGGTLTIETANVQLDEPYVQGHAVVRPGSHVLLAISDTGCGISPEVQSQIFEPFFTTKGPGKGTGLGLSTVYGVVEQSGGCISLHSEIGNGTTFKVFLPQAEGEAE